MGIVSQYTKLYCGKKKLGLVGTVLQYTMVYCDRGARGKAGLCHNTTQPSHDTAQALGAWHWLVRGRRAQARDTGGQQPEQAYNSLSRHTVGSTVLWHIEG